MFDVMAETVLVYAVLAVVIGVVALVDQVRR
jgi:preprotein translocase subunit SecE